MTLNLGHDLVEQRLPVYRVFPWFDFVEQETVARCFRFFGRGRLGTSSLYQGIEGTLADVDTFCEALLGSFVVADAELGGRLDDARLTFRCICISLDRYCAAQVGLVDDYDRQGRRRPTSRSRYCR